MQSLQVLILVKQSCNQDDDHSPLHYSYMLRMRYAGKDRLANQIAQRHLAFSLLLALQNLVAWGMRHAAWLAT